MRVGQRRLVLEDVVHVNDWERGSVAQAGVATDSDGGQSAGAGVDIDVLQAEGGGCIGAVVLRIGGQMDVRVTGLRLKQERGRENVDVVQGAVLGVVLGRAEVAGNITAGLDGYVPHSDGGEKSTHSGAGAVVCVAGVEQVSRAEAVV